MESKTNDTSSSIDSQTKDATLSQTNRRYSSRKLREINSTPSVSSTEVMDLWTWGNQPTPEQLKDCLQILCQEQKRLCGDAAGTTLYSYRFRQRATVLKRYYIAQCRKQSSKNAEKDFEANFEDLNENVQRTKIESDSHSVPRSEIGGSQGLARLGSRAALSFAFAFLRRAWRSGEDSDLCTGKFFSKVKLSSDFDQI